MGKYANRDWPWCDYRLETYIDEYNKIERKSKRWPSSVGLTLEEWNIVFDKYCSDEIIRKSKKQKSLLKKHKNMIDYLIAEGDPYLKPKRQYSKDSCNNCGKLVVDEKKFIKQGIKEVLSKEECNGSFSRPLCVVPVEEVEYWICKKYC